MNRRFASWPKINCGQLSVYDSAVRSMGGPNAGGVRVNTSDLIFGQGGYVICELCGRVVIRNQIFDRVRGKFAPVPSGKFDESLKIGREKVPIMFRTIVRAIEF